MGAIANAHNVDTVKVDSMTIRAHHAATTLKKDSRRCLDRSRGGLGTKIHEVSHQDGLPSLYDGMN